MTRAAFGSDVPQIQVHAMQAPEHWPELDVLRGLAAALMIINHAGFAWLNPESLNPLANTLLFVSSFAPVLFFFATGVGFGIRNRDDRRTSTYGSVWRKVLILLAADAALWFSFTPSLGLNFLGFIALSMLILHALSRSTRPLYNAALLLAVVLAARYLFGPLLRGEGLSAAIQFLLGVEVVKGYSYPPAPWLAFPLLGFLGGHWISNNSDVYRRWYCQWYLLAAGVVAAAVVAAVPLNMFRWGMMSFGYFLGSLAVLALALFAVIALHRVGTPQLIKAVSLRGVSSLAIVPIHYTLIALLAQTTAKAISLHVFLLLTPVLLLSSFLMAKCFASAGKWVSELESPNRLWVMYGLLIVALVLGAHANLTGMERYGIQLVLCLALITPTPGARSPFVPGQLSSPIR